MVADEVQIAAEIIAPPCTETSTAQPTRQPSQDNMEVRKPIPLAEIDRIGG